MPPRVLIALSILFAGALASAVTAGLLSIPLPH